MRIDRSNIKNYRFVILGAGRSGIAAAKLLSKYGGYVFVSESEKISDKEREAELLERLGIPSEFGGHEFDINDFDLMIPSPGIPLSAPVIRDAVDKIPIVGELEVASWFCESPIIAVTGSNGKSTTTALIGEIFRMDGRQYIVAGNIGNPFSDHVENVGSDGVAVLEVSSFQLETIESFHPKISVFLNLTPDHLDRHGSMEIYGKIKSKIFMNQTSLDYSILNGKDRRVLDLASEYEIQKVLFGVEKDLPICGFVKSGVIVLRMNEGDEELLHVSDMKIRGEHNTTNGVAAALSARLMGAAVESIRKALKNFSGLPHRMEFIREINGVRWINDSKATNIDSVWYALDSFDTPVVLIAGGRDKDSDFTLLRKIVKEKTKAVLLLGEAAEKMKRSFEGIDNIIMVRSLKEAVERAAEMAEPGESVLLSPACTSFDMFKNFEDRGDKFKKLVMDL